MTTSNGTTQLKGMYILTIGIHLMSSIHILSFTCVFTPFITCIPCIFGLLSLLCSTKWSLVRIISCFNNLFLRMFFSVGIICMVNPSVDNDAITYSNNSLINHRNIPESCHQHTAQKSRLVGINSKLNIKIFICLYHSLVKFSYGQNPLVVFFLVRSTGAMR